MAAPVRCVQELQTTERGRSLFTTEDVKAGDVLFEEAPLVCNQFSWNAACKYAACEFCMRSLESAEENARRLSKQSDLILPHPECCEINKNLHTICSDCGARYCSEVCRLKALKLYHGVLCAGYNPERTDHPLQILESAWREIHYPPESTSIGLIIKLIATLHQTDYKKEMMTELDKFCSRSKDEQTNSLHKLLGQQFSSGLETLRELLTHSLYEETVPQFYTTEGFRSLFAMIGTNGQGIGTSSLSVWVKNCDDLDLAACDRERLDSYIDDLYTSIEEADRVYDEDGMEIECTQDAFLNCEGSGLYVTQSAANHSCIPNAQISFPYNNSVLRFTATRDIPAHQEVFISYLDECMMGRSRHSRQKYLRENYLFICDCGKCESESADPDITSDDDEEEMEEMSSGEE